MAEEIKRVITVDTQQATQSIETWTKAIERGREKLANLEKGTKEYEDTLKGLEAAENQLTNIQQYYSESNQKILNTLEDLDGVGSKTFDRILKGLSSADKYTGIFGGSLTKITRTVTSVRKAIVTAFTAIKTSGTTALNAIKTGLASIGIGLIVIALSEIVAHFEDIVVWAKKLFPFLKSNTDELKEQQSILETQLDLMQKQHSWEVRLAKARGDSQAQILSLQSRQISQSLNAQKQLVANLEAQGKKGTEEWKKANEQLIEYRVQYKEQEKAVKDYNESLKKQDQTSVKAHANRKNELTEEQKLREQNLKHYDNLIKKIEESSKTEIEKLKEQEKQEIEIAESLGKETFQIREYYEKLITEAKQKETEARIKLEQEAQQKEIEAFNQAVEIREKAYREESDQITQRAQLQAELVDSSTLREWERKERLYEIGQEELNNQIDLINAKLEAEEYSDEEYQRMIERRNKLEVQQNQNEKKYAEYRKDLNKQAAQAIGKATADLFGTIAGQLDEGSKAWKAFSIMEATISTIQGAIGGYMQSVQTYPAPFGPILGAITAATAVATGIAQIAKIKNTKMDGGSEVSTGDYSAGTSVAVSPLLNEARDTQSLESLQVQPDSVTQAQQDQRVYVVESDITDAQRKVAVTEANATF